MLRKADYVQVRSAAMGLSVSGENRIGGWTQIIDVQSKYLLREVKVSALVKSLVEPGKKLSLRLRQSLGHSSEVGDG